MQYRTNSRIDQDISLMGYGCMRFTSHAGVIDQPKAEAELSAALEAGVDYFDVAYNYSGCEVALGKWLARGARDKVNVATKLPQFNCKRPEDFDRIFEEQLDRLQTDQVDFYLMHMLTSLTSWQRIYDMGITDWIERKKAEGRIRHIGFSYHGGREDFRAIVDAYDWEFCQIQLNYLDANSQAGLEGLHYAAGKGLPVIIMEPLRGGRLADKLPQQAATVFEKADPSLAPAAWGLRWLFDQPEVTCVLSGMNSVKMVEENCALADRTPAGSLTDEERAVYERAIQAIRAVEKIPCTGCGYCMPCPHGVDIPDCFHAYNQSFSEGYVSGLKTYMIVTSLKKEPANAGRCVGCGLCERNCSQSLPIRDDLELVAKRFENPIYRVANRFKGVAFKV